MLRLRTLGGLSIERIDGPVLSVSATSARRRLALLAMLAAAPRPLPRDRLLALFWPESDTDRARHALDQSLYALKRDLKADDLFVGREELSLNPNAISSDVGDFRAAIARGTPVSAVELYAGPFLDGVFVSGAPDVERWIDEERLTIAREVEAALEHLAGDAAARGDHRMAAQWWRRLAAMDPRKTRVIVALMSELASSGDRAGALRQAETYRTLVRDDLDADPNPAVTALAEQLKRDPQTTPAGSAPSPYTPGQSTPASRDAEQPLAGRYVIEREIGRGGASTVFLARDLRNERRVALKVLRRELGTGVAAERFRHEIAVTANLQHPHILPVHEWGEADGTLYFAMPFIEGESLRERLDREHTLAVDDAVRLARDIASALAYAHDRGIVHRDVKPENILLTSGFALIADFGIAHVRDVPGTASRPRRTDPGIILGTPAYLSPEQASGEFEIDARSDQYSLACLLYEALAGTPPFTAKDPIELLTKRLDAMPPSLASRRPDIPDHIDRAILRALATNPTHRFATVTEFAAALAPVKPTTGPVTTIVEAAPSSFPTAAWRELSVRTPALVAIGVVVIALGLTIGWKLAAARPLSERAWVVVADVENQTRDSVFDRALGAALLTGLQQSTYVNVLPRARIDQSLKRMRRGDSAGTMAAMTLNERTAREIAEREGVRGVVVASIDQVDSSYFLSVRVVDAKTGAALATERQQARRRSEILPAIDELVRRVRGDIGESANAIAKHDRPLPLATTRSLEALRKYADGIAASSAAQRNAARELWQGAIAIDSDFALAHAELGAWYYAGNDRPHGDEHYDRALALLDRLTEREQLQIRASVESFRGNRERAIEIRKALLAEYPDDPSAWGAIGYEYMRLARSQEAIDAYQRQLARDSGATAPATYLNLAAVYKRAGRFDEAREVYRHAFELQPAWLTFGNLNHEFGGALALGGHLDEARAVYDTMLRGDADQHAQGERSIGLLAMYRGHYAEARDHFRQSIVISQAAGPHRELTQARNRLFLAGAEEELGGAWRDSARAEVLAAHQLFRRAYMEPAFLMYLGKALVRSNQPALAKEVLDSLRRRAKPDNPIDRANETTLAAEIALASGRADTALGLLRVAYAGKDNPFIGESLARALELSGDRAGAAAQFEKIASSKNEWYGWEAQPYGLTAAFEAGRLYQDLGDSGRARAAFERQVAQWIDPDSSSSTLRETRKRLASLSLRPQ